MSKLTDKQRKQIVAEYVDGDGKISHRQLAQKFNVSQSTISKILKDEKSVQKCSDKKKANTLSMLAYIDSQSDKAQELILRQQVGNAAFHRGLEEIQQVVADHAVKQAFGNV